MSKRHYPVKRRKLRPRHGYFLASEKPLESFSRKPPKKHGTKIKETLDKQYLEKEREQIGKDAQEYVHKALKDPKKLDKLLQDISDKGTQKVAEEVIAKKAIQREKLGDKVVDLEKQIDTAFKYEPNTDAENTLINGLSAKWEVVLAILFKRTGSEILTAPDNPRAAGNRESNPHFKRGRRQTRDVHDLTGPSFVLHPDRRAAERSPNP